MKVLYTSPAGDFLARLGFARPEPVVVEILELDYETRCAKIRMPLEPNCVVNIARKVKGQAPILFAESSVPLTDLEFKKAE